MSTFENPPSAEMPVDVAAATQKTSLPATFMMVIAGISVLWNIVSVVLNMLGVGMRGLAPGGMGSDERFAQFFTGTLGVILAIIAIGINGVVIFGALKMKALENYAIAMAAAVLAILPCSCCCALNTPFGIWGLVVLLDANVKAAFRS